MWRIYCDDNLMYDDESTLGELKIVNPKIDLEDNAAGKLTFVLPTTNDAYQFLKLITSVITVYRDNQLYFVGRPVSADEDFWSNKNVTCEGSMAFLNDSIQPHTSYTCTLADFFKHLVTVHNAQVEVDKQFYLDDNYITITTIDDDQSIQNLKSWETNYESTMEVLQSLTDNYGGHIRVRYANDRMYLDYLGDYPYRSSQAIQFGRNLLNFTTKYEVTDFCSVIVPLGAEVPVDPDDPDAGTTKLTVESVNQGSIFVYDPTVIQNFGWISKKVEFDDIDDPALLLRYANVYLSLTQFSHITLELSAADLHYLNPDIEGFDILDLVECISPPHGMDIWLPITKMEIPLDQPINISYTLGVDSYRSLTAANSIYQLNVQKKFYSIPTRESVKVAAQEEATKLINAATGGYITIVLNQAGTETAELLIMDTNSKDTATKVWRWNINGLGYSPNGYAGPYTTAMTMNGSIVADFINTGTMSADRIRTGKINDIYGDSYFDLDVGQIFCGQSTGYWVSLDRQGEIKGGHGGTTYSTIDYTAQTHNLVYGTYHYGMMMTQDVLMMRIGDSTTTGGGLFTTVGMDPTLVGRTARTTKVTVPAYLNGDTSSAPVPITLYFYNGLLNTSVDDMSDSEKYYRG